MGTSTYGGSSDLSERMSGVGDAASRQFDRALDNAETVAARAAEQGKQALTAVDRTVRDQPLLVLAAVATLGIVIGALWKIESRRSRRWY